MRIGSLFSGVGGLDMAVQKVFDGRVIWHSEIDPNASKVLARHYPHVPNLGDITKIDWERVEPIDVLCAGFPCQDVSTAGKRRGLAQGTRSGLWSYVAEAVQVMRPAYVIIENVKGLLSARANRTVEFDQTDMGSDSAEPLLRAIGAVCGDLADSGYVGWFQVVSAATIGAPHRRDRVFILARDNSREFRTTPQPTRNELVIVQPPAPGKLLPTVRTTDSRGAGIHGDGGMDLKTVVTLLPQNGTSGEEAWGDYAPAIERWERITRPAPSPTELNRNGRPHLTAEFGEWMMGWPQGWVTDPAIGLTRAQQLRAAGNGVVWQQAALAISYLLSVEQFLSR